MTPPDPPKPILLFLLKVIHKVFGQVQWQAPEWIQWTGLQVRYAVRYLRADRKRLIIAALVFATAAGALTWYKLPRPLRTPATHG